MAGEQVMAQFNSVAGAAYGALGIAAFNSGSTHSFVEGVQQIDGSLFAWLLVTESLARHDEPESAWRWMDDQLRLSAWNRASVYDVLRPQIQNCWSSVLPILLLSAERRQVFMDTYRRAFGAAEYAAIHKLLLALWNRYGANLFQSGDWLADIKQPERYATPESACIVKLGLTLKSLAEQSSDNERIEWEAWQQLLKQGVLHKLPERIMRGFAPDSPIFEDVVLALLAVAEWLTFEQTWRIHAFLDDTDHRPAECLSPEQKILAGALYGWQRGYQRIGNLVTGQRQRATLSRQALRLSILSACDRQTWADTVSSLVLHSTEHGTLSALLAPFVQLSRYEQSESVEYDSVTQRLRNVKSGYADLQLAQQAFALHVELPYQNC